MLFSESFWHQQANFLEWGAFLIVFVIKFWMFGVFWWKIWNLCLFFRFFDQKNENLIGFLVFFSILVKSFRILAFFWPFKWIFDQFWEFFQYFDDCVSYSLGFWVIYLLSWSIGSAEGIARRNWGILDSLVKISKINIL